MHHWKNKWNDQSVICMYNEYCLSYAPKSTLCTLLGLLINFKHTETVFECALKRMQWPHISREMVKQTTFSVCVEACSYRNSQLQYFIACFQLYLISKGSAKLLRCMQCQPVPKSCVKVFWCLESSQHCSGNRLDIIDLNWGANSIIGASILEWGWHVNLFALFNVAV